MGRVLLVEDNRDLLHALQQVVTMGHYEVQTAHNGRVAQTLLAAGDFRPDVIVCDFRMPEMGGDTLLRWVRETQALAGVYFVMMSGDSDDKPKSFRLGANAYLSKPFELHTFETLLATYFSNQPPAASDE